MEAHTDEQYDDATVEIPAGCRAPEVALRLQYPDGRPAWDHFGAQRELVFLDPKSGARKIRVYF